MPHNTGGVSCRVTIFILFDIFVKEIAGKNQLYSSVEALWANKTLMEYHGNTS